MANGLLLFSKIEARRSLERTVECAAYQSKEVCGREESPSLGIIDFRSVKISHHVDTDRGIDGNKKIKGRKEHIVVDTLGLPMAIKVHEANVHDGKGAKLTIENFAYKFPRLSKILADGGYQGDLLHG